MFVSASNHHLPLAVVAPLLFQVLRKVALHSCTMQNPLLYVYVCSRCHLFLLVFSGATVARHQFALSFCNCHPQRRSSLHFWILAIRWNVQKEEWCNQSNPVPVRTQLPTPCLCYYIFIHCALVYRTEQLAYWLLHHCVLNAVWCLSTVYSWTAYLTPPLISRLLLVRLSSLITLIAVILIQIQCTQPFPEQTGTQCSVDFSLLGILNGTELDRDLVCPEVRTLCMHWAVSGCGLCTWSPAQSCSVRDVHAYWRGSTYITWQRPLAPPSPPQCPKGH